MKYTNASRARRLLSAITFSGAFLSLVFTCLNTANAVIITESAPYLIVSRNSITSDTTLSTSNFELGANKAPVPSTDSFLDGGSTGGPTLLGAVPDLPTSGIKAVDQGIGGHGNLAITDTTGYLDLQNVGVYADDDVGIRMSAADESRNVTSNSFFNDPNEYPNTFDTNTQMGVTVTTLDADQDHWIDPSGGGNASDNTGITYGYDHSALEAELALAKDAIANLAATGSLDLTGNSGKISSDETFTASPGLNVIDIITGSDDFLLENSNWVIDGPAGSTVIFRLQGNNNMLISDANILLGDGGIGMNNVLFFTDQEQNDTHFGFSNTIINGVAFWSLGSTDGGSISIDNAQGSTQLIAENVGLSDVRFTRWAFTGGGFNIPEPSSFALVAVSLGVLGVARRRVRG